MKKVDLTPEVKAVLDWVAATSELGPFQPPIITWRFYDAPKALQDLSTNGGDEDWLTVVPAKAMDEYYIGWLQEGTSYGCCCVEVFEYPDGTTVHIGSHS